MKSQLNRKTRVLARAREALALTLACALALTAFVTPASAVESVAGNSSQVVPAEQDNPTGEVAQQAETSALASSTNEIEADSWRFQDGVLTNPSEGGLLQTYSGEALPAWSKTDEGYISSNGTVISGAYRRGIDVSEWQETIDWDSVAKDNVDFVIIRCAVGTTKGGHWYSVREDETWRRNVSECERLGIPYGLYFYTAAETLDQARTECDFVNNLLSEVNPAYPFYLDMERELLEDTSYRDFHASVATMFADMVASHGIDYGVYANLNWWTNYLTDPVFDNWERWVAQYYYTCNYRGTYKVWQCTSEAKVEGIQGLVDLNFEFGGYFRDVDYNDWYVTGGHFDYIITNKIMYGYTGSYKFGPFDYLTRGQLACVLYNLEGSPSASAAAFDDVDYSAYYGDAITWARATNVIYGFGDNNFGPDEYITREDLCCMLANYAEMKDLIVSPSLDSLSVKPDASSLSPYALSAVSWAVANGIISGVERDGIAYLMPQDNAWRASAVTMVVNLMKML